jgi:hypothetical protein
MAYIIFQVFDTLLLVVLIWQVRRMYQVDEKFDNALLKTLGTHKGAIEDLQKALTAITKKKENKQSQKNDSLHK